MMDGYWALPGGNGKAPVSMCCGHNNVRGLFRGGLYKNAISVASIRFD